jgi:ribose transport system permease protein
MSALIQRDTERQIGAKGPLPWFQLIFKSSELGTLFFILLLSLALTLTTRQFLNVSNLAFAARAFSFIAITAMGACFIIISGGIDLSVGSVMGLAGVVGALISSQGGSPAAAIAGALAAGLAVGAVNGFLISILGPTPFIVTLGMLSVGRGLVYVVTGGWPMSGFQPSILFLGQGFFLGIPIPVWIMVVFMIVLSLLLERTSFGWYVKSIGGNEEAARLSGIPVRRVKFLVYLLGGFMGAVGGFLLVARLGVGETTAGISYELQVIAAAVIGGVSLKGGEGTVFSAVLGAALMGILRNGLVLLGVGSFWQQIVIGSVIIIAVLVDKLRRQ